MDDKTREKFFESFSQIDKHQGQLFEYSTKIGGHTLRMGERQNESACSGPLARRLKQNLCRHKGKLREHQHRALWTRQADECLQPIDSDTQDVSAL
jgi:hypothetical protein